MSDLQQRTCCVWAKHRSFILGKIPGLDNETDVGGGGETDGSEEEQGLEENKMVEWNWGKGR